MGVKTLDSQQPDAREGYCHKKYREGEDDSFASSVVYGVLGKKLLVPSPVYLNVEEGEEREQQAAQCVVDSPAVT